MKGFLEMIIHVCFLNRHEYVFMLIRVFMNNVFKNLEQHFRVVIHPFFTLD